MDGIYTTIEVEATRAGVAVITLNRSNKHNAFNADVISELSDVFDALKGQDGVRLIILRGAGKSFSAGADLDWMKAAADYTREENEEDAIALAAMLRKLYELPQLTLALVQGAAMGGGAGLVAACDVAIAMASTKFRFSEVRLGLTPATISPFVIEAIGPSWARALFATGEMFDAAYAEKIGLVHYTAANTEELLQLEEHIAGLVFTAAPGAIDDSKALVRDVTGKEINGHLGHETAKRIAARRASDEGREGLSAFLEKRKPSWAEDI
ncbi:MAG: enoyl-CoA hydratase-related protein [Pseudomonadota bacterium]